MSVPSPTFCNTPATDIKREGLPLIYAENLIRRFQGKRPVTAVEQVTAGIQEGLITAIIGESGSGKSTLLRLLYGLLEPDSGEVRYRGLKVPGPREKLIPGHDAMRLVSQHADDLNTYADVWDNIASRLSNTDLQAKEQQTAAILERLGIRQLARQRVADLSGGERQRVAIARALVTGPEVLLMDEPFNQVDAAFRDALQRDIRRIVRETGLTVVMVSHDPTEVLAIADFLLVMHYGKLIASGVPAILYEHPPHPYSAMLLAKSNILSFADAALLGIHAAPGTATAIYPEWLTARPDPSGLFVVRDLFFKGFYQEADISCGDLTIRVIHNDRPLLQAGQQVTVQVNRYVTF